MPISLNFVKSVNIGLAGAQFTNIFPSQFKCDGNFIWLSSKFWYSDRYKILYMARQLWPAVILLKLDSNHRFGPVRSLNFMDDLEKQ